MQPKDPILKTALQLQARLDHCRDAPQRDRRYILAGVEEQSTVTLRRLSYCRLARQRHWHLAARVAESAAIDALRQLQHGVNNALLQLQGPKTPSPVRLRELYDDVQQLELEFDGVTLDARHRLIAATTAPIQLEDIPLGAFRIELHLDRLGDRPSAAAFDIVALQPNPPDCSEDVTHPHVRDRQLCAGEATMPIARALQQGRITDAFLAVRSVLETYNSSSPYVALEDWHGRPCGDCGTTVDPEQASSCEQCGQVCCEECASWCDICESSFCRCCLEEDIESGRLCCRSCRHRCGACNRIVDADSWVEETGLCPCCHEERIAEQEQENEHDESDASAGQPNPSCPVEPSPATPATT
ncbi:MAG TPA: hypothetical protein VK968_18260 [Roseimicrobium sp.]|nr:hypothetical protein [Roseimicrobium sp.]